MGNEKAATVLGTLGTVCWCIQLIPQVYYNYRRKNCEGFPPLMMFLWAACGIPFSIYFMSTRSNVSLQVQPEVFFCFCTIAWIQTLYYPPVQLSKKKITLMVVSFILFAIGCQVGFILWLRPLHDRGITWPTLIFGVIASVLLAVGLLPPYFELAKRKGRVVGINFWFIGIDCAGAFFSMLSVVVGSMDIMGIILYCVCMALEVGIFTSHFIWCLRFKWFRKSDDLDSNDDVELGLGDKESVEKKRSHEVSTEILDHRADTHSAVDNEETRTVESTEGHKEHEMTTKEH
ncbi:unnamed protein product [Wickerhamomyces anomalus]